MHNKWMAQGEIQMQLAMTLANVICWHCNLMRGAITANAML